jgi:transposase
VIFPGKRLMSFSGGTAMEVVYPHCRGLDVHKRFVVASLSSIEQGQRHKALRQFSTMTNEIVLMKEWLKTSGCTHMAMESTGVSWKPIFHLLEGAFELVLVNAHHMKAVPGRKTDVKDAEWIADLLHHGELSASFIRGSEQQAVRDLTRTRMRFMQARTRLINRIQKVLEDANIKLASVVSDSMGGTGQAILRARVSGQEDRECLAHLARGSLLKKQDQLQAA